MRGHVRLSPLPYPLRGNGAGVTNRPTRKRAENHPQTGRVHPSLLFHWCCFRMLLVPGMIPAIGSAVLHSRAPVTSLTRAFAFRASVTISRHNSPVVTAQKSHGQLPGARTY